ncbi:MAG: phage holin family protein [Myxococcota bacterium]
MTTVGSTETGAPRGSEAGRAAQEGNDRAHAGVTIGGLARELLAESSALIRGEVMLASREIQGNISKVERGVAAMSVGAAVFHGGMLAVMTSAILALSLIWPAWLSALIVGVAVALLGLALLAAGQRKARSEGLVPRETMRSMQETGQFARDEGHRAREVWR